MIQAQDGETRVRIHQVNTGGLVDIAVPISGGQVEYRASSRSMEYRERRHLFCSIS